jgi:spermidine synthase
MQGLHLTADLFECACPTNLFTDRGVLQETCIRLVKLAGLSVVGDDFHQFTDASGEASGVTGLVLLAESHLAVHTWPELNAVTLDVYVCNFREDNTSKATALADSLVDLFQPGRSNRNSLQRGSPRAPDSPDRNHLALEWLTPDVVHGFARRRRPAVIQTSIQRLEWHDTRALGKVFSLDDAFMASEGDEFIYHECMVHVPALTHGSPKSALVMGGGDGCSARELLRYPGINRIVVAELDAMVVASCRQQFAETNEGALDNARVDIRIGDALATLRESDEQYDLIIMDLTDPGNDETSPANSLYSPETYALVRSRLTPNGLVTLHLGSAFYHPERFRRTLDELRNVFPQVAAYKAFMPVYGSEWGMACASMQGNPAILTMPQIKAGLAAHRIEGLRFYTPRVHASLFAWPAYAELLGA